MRTKLAIIGAAVCLARAAFAVTMASQPWTTNRIAEAEARVASNIVEAIDAIPAPDFSTGNAQLRATIAAVSPPADLTEATNHTRAALSAFAWTGTVARATTYGTPTRWTDATGCVWEVGQVIGPWSFSGDGMPLGVTFSVQIVGEPPTFTYLLLKNDSLFATTSGEDDEPMSIRFVGTDYDSPDLIEFDIVTSRSYQSGTNLVGRVALTNDIPATLPESDPTVSSWAKAGTKPSYSWNEITGKPQVVDETGAAAIAETVVREKSLGGIWDTQLEVWWTPVMRNGALTYQATTNVNLNAEN